MRKRTMIIVLMTVAVAGCGRRDPEAPTVAELLDKLEKGTHNMQMEALRWVKQLGPKAAQTKVQLIGILNNPSPLIRQHAAAALGAIGPEAADAVPALTAALRDPEANVRKAAADALGQLGPAAVSATSALEELAKGSDPCDAAQAALKKIRR
jgi:HEAT repeat protein